MSIFWMGLALGILLGSGLRKLLVPITPDGRTEMQIIEEAYTVGYDDGMANKAAKYLGWGRRG